MNTNHSLITDISYLFGDFFGDDVYTFAANSNFEGILVEMTKIDKIFRFMYAPLVR